jgi:hypothetical protein
MAKRQGSEFRLGALVSFLACCECDAEGLL